jgi:hypothetical protein
VCLQANQMSRCKLGERGAAGPLRQAPLSKIFGAVVSFVAVKSLIEARLRRADHCAKILTILAQWSAPPQPS